MKVATLKETRIERWYPSKKAFGWSKAYIITTPEGKELFPPIAARSNHYEISAREFCKQCGWKVKITK